MWIGNQLDPEQWGWPLINNVLEPIHTLLPPLPEKLLHTIFFNCKKGSYSKYSRKKVGLICSPACTSCQGQSCSNNESSMDDDPSIDNEQLMYYCYKFMSTQEDEEEEEMKKKKKLNKKT